jgi:hypothetical protein
MGVVEIDCARIRETCARSLLFRNVVSLFRRLAPAAHLEFHALGPTFDYEEALERGKLDIVVGNWPAPPEQLRRSPLFSDEIVCLVSDKHPFASRLRISTDQYLGASHVVPTSYSLNQRGIIDTHLSRERMKRNVVVTLPFFFGTICSLAVRSDFYKVKSMGSKPGLYLRERSAEGMSHCLSSTVLDLLTNAWLGPSKVPPMRSRCEVRCNRTKQVHDKVRCG